MQRKKAIELQKAWGDRPCDHPAFAREYDLGERTGNYCCTQCGAIVSFREKAEITAARPAAPAPQPPAAPKRPPRPPRSR